MIHFSILESSPQDMQDFLLFAPVGKKLPREIRPRRERKNLAHAKKLGYSRFKLISHDIFKNPCKNVQKSYSM